MQIIHWNNIVVIDLYGWIVWIVRCCRQSVVAICVIAIAAILMVAQFDFCVSAGWRDFGFAIDCLEFLFSI